MSRHEGRLRDLVALRQETAGLLAELAWVLARKCRRLGLMSPLGDRGTLVSQVLGRGDHRYLMVYEAGYRESIWPRVVYMLVDTAPGDGHNAAIREAIRMERRRRDAVVAQRDRRLVASVEGNAEDFAGTLLDGRGNETREEPVVWAKDRPLSGRCSARQTVLVRPGHVDEERVRVHGAQRCELAHGHPGKHRAGIVEWARLDPSGSTE